eukprot:scaffold155_cov347-Pavlova_lutheri.AAC.110
MSKHFSEKYGNESNGEGGIHLRGQGDEKLRLWTMGINRGSIQGSTRGSTNGGSTLDLRQPKNR